MREPKFLSEMVRTERELAAAQEAFDKAYAKEMREQERPGFFQKLFQDPKQAFAGMKDKAKDFMRDLSDELSKGGVGGVLDTLLSKGKGAMGGAGGATNALLGGILGGQGGGGMLSQAGGMLGEVFGGPAGAMVGEAVGDMLQKAVKQAGAMLAAPAERISAVLGGVNHALKELGGLLGPIGLGFDAVSASMQGMADTISGLPLVGDLLGPFAQALAGMPSILKDITSSLTQFAGVASPAQMNMFRYAVEDVQGVIGRTFIPVLELMRDAVRAFGDALATVLPNTQEMARALAPLRQTLAELYDELRRSLGDAGPMIREGFLNAVVAVARAVGNLVQYSGALADFYSAMYELGTVFTEVLAPVRELLGPFQELLNPARTLGNVLRIAAGEIRRIEEAVRSFLQSLGLVGPRRPGEPRSGFGAAAREAQFSSFEEYNRQQQLASFREPGRVGMEEVPNLVGEANRRLGEIAAALQSLTPAAIADAIARALPNPREAAQTAASGAANVFTGGLRDQLGVLIKGAFR